MLLVDADPQGDLTTALGWTEADNLDVTLTTQMKRVELVISDRGTLIMES